MRGCESPSQRFCPAAKGCGGPPKGAADMKAMTAACFLWSQSHHAFRNLRRLQRSEVGVRSFAIWHMFIARAHLEPYTVPDVSGHTPRANLKNEPRSPALGLGPVGPALRVLLLLSLIVRILLRHLICPSPGARFAPALLSLLGCHALLCLPHHLPTEGRLLQPYIHRLAECSDEQVRPCRQGRAANL